MNDFVFQEGDWIWGSSGVPFSYTNWNRGQPNNWRNEDCLYIKRDKKKWYDHNCDDTRSMKPLCQIDA